MEPKSFEAYISTVKSLREELPAFKDLIDQQQKGGGRMDKYGYGWNTDNRFSSNLSLKVFFSSYKGYYGNSGCSTAVSLGDSDLLQEAFLKYLDSHTQDIFNWMADYLEEKSDSARVEKIAKLKAELVRLEALDKKK